MILSSLIRQAFEQVFGQALRYPGDYEALAEVIFDKTRERVSVNTLKRLFGFIGPEVEPRQSTLDILARYLGEADWAAFQARLSGKGNSDFEQDPRNVDAAALAAGARVSFRYHPDRKVAMKHLGAGRFRVTASEHSKLRAGDIVTVRSFCPGYPLSADSVVRDGVDLGPFVAGKVAGLTDLHID